jgi:signal transduction histidine kinase/CheY-like chemotaxis protein
MEQSHLRKISELIERGEELDEILALFKSCLLELIPDSNFSIYLPSINDHSKKECFVYHGQIIQNVADTNYGAKTETSEGIYYDNKNEKTITIPFVSLGVVTGLLILDYNKKLTHKILNEVLVLSKTIFLSYEQQRLGGNLQHLLDRLQILNNLNQLIASNVALEKLLKNIVRESAFRFSADIVLVLLLNSNGDELEVSGGYGCKKEAIPISFSSDDGVLGQVIKTGSHIAVSNLSVYQNHGLDFLISEDITSVDVCCLEVRGDAQGIILLGFKRSLKLSPEEEMRFEEFSRGAAVAIANARSQQRIKAYTERLEELVERRTKDLAVQTERANEANKAKSRFLANMSHELRTPLTAIVGYSSIISEGLFGEVNTKQKDALSSIIKSSQHLKNLIDDILNLARIESGKEEPEPTIVNIKEALYHVHKVMLQSAISKQLEFPLPNIHEELKDSNIFSDQKHFHQILLNLISNAIKYTPDGGKVSISVEKLADKVKISITDTGVGISTEKLKKLFDRFERGDDAYSRSQEGTGIGLNLTKRLAQLNGANIGVESSYLTGSTFWVLFPLAQRGKEHETEFVVGAQEINSNQRLDGLSAVIVDDNSATLDILKIILERAGATTQICFDVASAIENLKARQPDVLITDIAMPGENGIDLIQKVRLEKIIPKEVPIIVLSACAFQEDKDAATDAGATFFLSKPFRPSEIITAVRSLTLASAMKRRQVTK